MSNNQRVRKILVDGPATRHEIRLGTRLNYWQIHQSLMQLSRQGHIRTTGQSIKKDESVFGPKYLKLYGITVRGQKAFKSGVGGGWVG